ncbi:hypothetical protein ENH_00052150 [Eimeria necatrix]|uniref:Integrase catalytic domain-containing protein n=1 Tax=Eimeria necatrix TaxID=51315 RepID=U6MWT2_9EIME|nr:hypothetical protein ENH_00052150 [Eimeria necatrix]CDJ68431.1 hypothetical protein ENH_00052150 [Eimeria necatrix]
MNPTQQKYSAYDQELLPFVTALDKWSHLLRVTRVTAHTDHQAVTHLQRFQASKPLRGRTARWLDFLAEFPDLHIAYLQAARIQVADAFFRRSGLPNTCSHDTPSTPLMLAVTQARAASCTRGRPANHKELAGIRSQRSRQRTLPSPPTPPPPETNPEAEHPTPTTKTRADPPGAPEWPQAYSKCPVFRAPYEASAKQPGDAIQIEFRNRHVTFRYVPPYLHIYLPLTTTGHDSILVMVDSPSKIAHFVPAKKSFTAADTVELLADRLIGYHGFPEVLISDREPHFQSDLWQQLCHRFNIKQAMSSSYHPQSDGQTERVNRTLEQMLRTYIQSDEREWERLLSALELAYNTTSHSSTEVSPFEVMIGENPLTAANLDMVGALALPHRPGPRDLVLPEADVGCPLIRDAAGTPTEECEVDYIMDQRGSGDEAQYLMKWHGSLEDKPHGSQLTTIQASRLYFALGAAASEDVFRLETILVLTRRRGLDPSLFTACRTGNIRRGGRRERCVPHALTTLASEENRD